MTLPRHRPRWLLSVLLLLGILCSGCVITAVYPFYHARDTYFDPDLVGDWMVNDSATERWRFERLTPTGNSYRLTAIDLADPSGKTDSKPTVLIATLFRLRGNLFLDLFSTDRDEAVIPPHVIQKVRVDSGEWKLSGLNEKWVRERLQRNPRLVRHLIDSDPADPSREGRIVLTADTAELQRFLRQSLPIEAAWDPPTRLRRPAKNPAEK